MHREANRVVAIGSTGKGMTAMAVMQLVEQGLVDLDAPIVRHLPEFTMDDPRAGDVTLRQLLSMSAGIPASDAFDGAQDDQALERRAAASPRSSSTVTRAVVSTTPTTASTGLIVQRVTGLAHDDYMAAHIFAPLACSRLRSTPREERS